MAWDPAQYLKFAGPRLRPALDLLQRIDKEAPSTVYDLGAGAGNVTRLLAARWPQARIVGVDSSAEMLVKAAAENPRGSLLKTEARGLHRVAAGRSRHVAAGPSA